MAQLIPIDGSLGEGGGQILRTALAVAAATGRGFHIEKIRARRARPGLRPQHVAAVNAAALACEARVGGCFEGSPDLRFEPGALAPGQFRHEIGTAGSVTLVLQTVLPALTRAGEASEIAVVGGSHVPRSPGFEFLARHWAPLVARAGCSASYRLERAGFHPPGGGEVVATTVPASGPAAFLDLEKRGPLVAVRVMGGATRTRLDLARRACDALRDALWERERLEIEVEVFEQPAASPGWYLYAEAEYEPGRGAFGALGEKQVTPERQGARVARLLRRFMDRSEAVDAQVADQLAVPMALSGAGGRLTTPEITSHLETVVATLQQFELPVALEGRRGLAGILEVSRS